jgi:hypothetical protein
VCEDITKHEKKGYTERGGFRIAPLWVHRLADKCCHLGHHIKAAPRHRQRHCRVHAGTNALALRRAVMKIMQLAIGLIELQPAAEEVSLALYKWKQLLLYTRHVRSIPILPLPDDCHTRTQTRAHILASYIWSDSSVKIGRYSICLAQG